MEPPSALVCEKCGAPAEMRQSGSTRGVYCTKCDWALVTTYVGDMAKDMTKYEVRILTGDAQNERHIRAVASVSGVNFIAAKKLLSEAESVVFVGRAARVLEVRSLLDGAGITSRISPDFKY